MNFRSTEAQPAPAAVAVDSFGVVNFSPTSFSAAGPSAAPGTTGSQNGHLCPPLGQAIVILPVYNEARSLPDTLKVLRAHQRNNPAQRFVFVDDGSSDNSAEILRAETPPYSASTSELAGLTHIILGKNHGKGGAIKAAVAQVSAEAILVRDGDLAYSPDHIEQLLAGLSTSDVVIGSRRESPEDRRNTKKLRRLMGWSFNALVRIGMGLPHDDTQAGLKGFRGAAAKAVFERVTLRGFAFDVEMLFIARKLGYSITEVPARVSRSHRKMGSNVNLFLDPARMALDLFKVRWNWLLGRYK